MAISENVMEFFKILIVTTFIILVLLTIITIIIMAIYYYNKIDINKYEDPIIENIYLNDSKEITIKLNVSNKINPDNSFIIYLKKINSEIIKLIIGENKKIENNCILIYGIAPGNIIIENGDIIKLFNNKNTILDKNGNENIILNNK